MHWLVVLTTVASVYGAWHWWSAPRGEIRGPGGFVWNTSLTRNDSGNGACEIVYVESLSVD